MMLAVCGLIFFVLTAFSIEDDGRQELDAKTYCHVVGIPVTKGLYSYKLPSGVKESSALDEIDISPPESDSKWLYRAVEKGEMSIDKNRGWRRADFSIQAIDIIKKDKVGAKTIRTVDDFNKDGITEIANTECYSDDSSGIPPTYTLSIYGVNGNDVIPYLVIRSINWGLEPIVLSDGTTGFANTPMIWHRQMYRWRNASFRLTNEAVGKQYYDLKRTFVDSLLSLEALHGVLFGLIPAALAMLICYPIFGICSKEFGYYSIILSGVQILYIVFFGVLLLNYGFEQHCAILLVATIPLLITSIVLLVVSIMKVFSARTEEAIID